MSRCLNKATLIGNLGADPEIRTISSGVRVAQFSLATSLRWTDRGGEQREKTQWHRIVVWDSLPATFAFVEKYVRKGDRVYVEGEIEYRSYDDHGTTRWMTEIKAGDVLSAGPLSGGEEPRSNSGSAQTRSRTRRTHSSDTHQMSAL